MAEIKIQVQPENKKTNTNRADTSMPSVYNTKIKSFRDCERKALSIQQIPLLVMMEFEKLAKENDMTKKQFLYEMLRKSGADIPPYKEIHKSGGF